MLPKKIKELLTIDEEVRKNVPLVYQHILIDALERIFYELGVEIDDTEL